MGLKTIPARIVELGRQRPNDPALYHFENDTWSHLTWSQYSSRAAAFAAALLAHDCPRGQGVAIMSDGCPEWLIADVGAMMVGAVPAGVYQTSTAEQVAYIVSHCEARVFVVQNRELWSRVSSQLMTLPDLQRVVLIEGQALEHEEIVCSFRDFLDMGSDRLSEVDAHVETLKDDDLATLIYTSGTTGPPKGVMLSHHNLAWTAQMLDTAAGGIVDSSDCVVSYLPLSHIAEQMFSIYLPATYGFPIWFAGSLDRLKETLVQARPTIFLAVPRVWEKFKTALETKLNDAIGLKSLIINWARGVGGRSGPSLFLRGHLTGALKLKHRLASRLFFKPLTRQIGLDRLKLAVSGAAPIGRDVLEFFQSCGLLIHEVYGQSEDTGPTSFNRPIGGERRLGTVGKPVPGVDVRIAPDGEICVRGPNVFLGYYKDPAATDAALVDGWLLSGDIGEFDADGFLKITDRKKDLIITAGGKNVAPQTIESRLRSIPGISQAVVIGDRRKYLSALLTIDEEQVPHLSEVHGWPQAVSDCANDETVLQYLQRGVDGVNGRLARYEQIKTFSILPVDFSVEGGQLTPTQKVKRKVVSEIYKAEIEQLYPTI
ncbi:MAG: long-chain fatty acid--CoA ligase [Myxococcales bacterium]|nr:long-chain fatty acid--CoA ligase [Myxococcales bacterium]